MTCTYGKDLAVNELAPVITLTTRLAADVAPGTVITNTGTGHRDHPGPDPGQQHATTPPARSRRRPTCSS